MRDEFSKATKELLANRVGWKCSNPNCRKTTSGAGIEGNDVINIGVAAHITAASKCGPRYNKDMSEKERKSYDNGIWLCQSCAKLIDSDLCKYTVDVLKKWKKISEELSREELEGNSNKTKNIHTFSDFIELLKYENNYTGILDYRNKQIGLYGREKEVKEIELFLNDERDFMLYILCGETGIGKSKLINSFIHKEKQNKDWKMFLFDYAMFKKVLCFNEFSYTKKLFIAFDNVGKYSIEFAQWLDFLLHLKKEFMPFKLKLLLIEREGLYYKDELIELPNWYKNISKTIGNSVLNNFLFNYDYNYGFMRLSGIDKTSILKMLDDCRKANLIKKERISCFKKERKSDNHNLNPFYSILKCIKENLNDSIDSLLQSKDQCVKNLSQDNKQLYDDLYVMLTYATIVEPWKVGEEEKLPSFFEKTAENILDTLDEIDLIDFVCQINEKEKFDGYLYGIEPDFIGEFLVIKYLDKKKLHKSFFKKLICELTKEHINELIHFMSNYMNDFVGNYHLDTVEKVGKCLREINNELSIHICKLMKGKDFIFKINLVLFISMMGQADGFTNKVLFKAEILRLFINDRPCIISKLSLDYDMIFNIILLRECQRTKKDSTTNPIYLSRAIPYLKKWGFSDEVCEAVEKSSIFIKTKKPIDSYIISIIDIFGELLLDTEKREGYPTYKALDYVAAQVEINTDDEKYAKELFIDYVVEVEELIKVSDEFDIEGMIV